MISFSYPSLYFLIAWNKILKTWCYPELKWMGTVPIVIVLFSTSTGLSSVWNLKLMTCDQILIRF